MEPNHNSNQKQYIAHEDEIDLIALAKTLWNGRKTILKVTAIFMAIGLFVALFSAPQYTATTVIRPVLSSSKSGLSGSLGGLAAMAGINLGSAGSSSVELPPSLYPQIVESFAFQKQLLATPLSIEGVVGLVTYQEYYTEHYSPSVVQYLKKYTLGLPGLLLSSLRGEKEQGNAPSDGIQRMTGVEDKLLKLLSSQVSLNINEKEGYVSLSATLPEALAATQLLLKAQDLLQQEVIAFKIKKTTDDLNFIQERFVEKKAAFNNAQQNLAKYRDANKNVNTAIALTEVERLESEYQLAFSVYSELAKQVEAKKLQVKEDTPVFAVLQEAVVPLKKSGASKSLTLIIWTFLGGILGIALVFGKTFLADVKKKWDEDSTVVSSLRGTK